MSSTKDEQPDIFHVFVSRAGFWTRHNLDFTGCLISGGLAAAFPETVPPATVMMYDPGPEAPHGDALQEAFVDGSLDYLQFTPNAYYFGWPTPFASTAVSGYRVEYDAEVCRRYRAPLKPSRLSAVFAFADLDTCTAASRAYRWNLDEVQQFRLRDHPHNRVARANMEIVSLMLYAYPRGSWGPEELDDVWSAYWNEATEVTVEVPVDGTIFEPLTSGCLWEYLIEGCLERQ